MIRLRFVREQDAISSAIAWFSHAPVSHVGALLDDGSELGSRNDVVAGIPSGVQVRPPNYAKFAYQVTFLVPASPEQEKRFWDFLHSQIGKPYDRIAILGFITGRNWREEDAWFCSEVISRALEVAGIVPSLYLMASKIEPADLALVVSAIGGVRDNTSNPSPNYAQAVT